MQIKKEMSTASMADSASADEARHEGGAIHHQSTRPTATFAVAVAIAAAGSNRPTEHGLQMQWEQVEEGSN
jgi:hypothetical protein